MPNDPNGNVSRTFTDAEVEALAADRVNRETADLQNKVSSLETEKSDLESRLDVETAAKVAAEQARDTVQADFDTYKSTVEAEREAAARKETRIAELREVAGHLGDTFFEDEGRVKRICAFDDDSFAAYKADLAATATPAAPGSAPRETAMSGAPAAPARSDGAGSTVAPAAHALFGRGLTAVKEG